ncbi:MAG: hemerythrin domain-containing protein [Xanthobacteraceae bacterium]|jgi:hemerythrin-like domain-containing protein
MTELIDVLRQEHRNIKKLLKVLERELAVFDRSDRPDYEVLRGVIDYFMDYPDACHHPKEDLIYAKLAVRDRAAVTAVGDLEAEHREGARRLRRVALAVEKVLDDQDLLRRDVDKIVRDFIVHERRHMAKEERLLFPAALKALQPADWADIALQLADRYDPLSAPSVEAKYEALRRTILKLEDEAEAERVH